jgi:hypothetical protein
VGWSLVVETGEGEVMRRSFVAVAVVVLGAVGAAAPAAGARTLTVDDNHTPCGSAQFTTIQAAVDVARSGDTINVCAGTYREDVTVSGGCALTGDPCPPLRRNVKLVSTPRRAAHIVAPASFSPDGSGALIALNAPGSSARGFVLSGALPPVPDGACGSIGGASAIVATEAGTSVFDNDIHGVTTATECPFAFVALAGVRLTGQANTTVDMNVMDRVGDIDILVENGRGNVLRNTLRSTGRGGLGIYFDEDGSGIARVNDIARFHAGLQASNAFSGFDGPVRMVGNKVTDSDYGLLVVSDNGANVDAQGNELLGNGTGISMALVNIESGLGAVGTLRGNIVRDSEHNGIEMGDTDFLIRDNVVQRSGDLDCFDFVLSRGGTGRDVWTNNIGAKDDPGFICRP